MAPEQWWGSVDGHSFYFRERHGDWRLELDLRPSGHFYRAWSGDGDLEDEDSYELEESQEGDVIAQGSVEDEGYGRSPVERVELIARTIRDHLCRQSCAVHTDQRADLESRLGWPLAWCPGCGQRL